MRTWLLTWNPKRFSWDDIGEDLEAFEANGRCSIRWSCGNNKSIADGDRVFLLRQGVEPRGIVASGHVVGTSFEDDHWDPERTGTARYVDIDCDALMDPEEGMLELSQLLDGPLSRLNWRTQVSGISIAPDLAEILEGEWAAFRGTHGRSTSHIAEEIPEPAQYQEGASQRISVNSYERDPRARKACVDHYGAVCAICDFEFGRVYGELGAGFIVVHHLVPLSDIGATYMVDPIKDLRPVCANCHAMLHKDPKRVLQLEELRAIVAAAR